MVSLGPAPPWGSRWRKQPASQAPRRRPLRTGVRPAPTEAARRAGSARAVLAGPRIPRPVIARKGPGATAAGDTADAAVRTSMRTSKRPARVVLGRVVRDRDRSQGSVNIVSGCYHSGAPCSPQTPVHPLGSGAKPNRGRTSGPLPQLTAQPFPRLSFLPKDAPHQEIPLK